MGVRLPEVLEMPEILEISAETEKFSGFVQYVWEYSVPIIFLLPQGESNK